MDKEPWAGRRGSSFLCWISVADIHEAYQREVIPRQETGMDIDMCSLEFSVTLHVMHEVLRMKLCTSETCCLRMSSSRQ